MRKLRGDFASAYETLCHSPNVCSIYILKKEEINGSTNEVYFPNFERISAYFHQSDLVTRGLVMFKAACASELAQAGEGVRNMRVNTFFPETLAKHWGCTNYVHKYGNFIFQAACCTMPAHVFIEALTTDGEHFLC